MIRIQLKSPRPSGGLIRCRDCGATDRIAVYGPGNYTLPEGWQTVRHWLRHLYYCPDCANRHVERVKRTLGIH